MVQRAGAQACRSQIATFILDSFTGRKITSTALFEARLSRADRLTDVFEAQNLLARLKEIDETRIRLSSYSVGGTTAILAAGERTNWTSLARGRSFGAILPVYPACQVWFSTPLAEGCAYADSGGGERFLFTGRIL